MPDESPAVQGGLQLDTGEEPQADAEDPAGESAGRRQSRAVLEGLVPTVYKYAVKGAISPAILAEVRRQHIVRNKLTEIMRSGDERVAELHAAQPEVAAAEALAAGAAATVAELKAAIQKRKADNRTRRPDPVLTAALKSAYAVRNEAVENAKAARKQSRARLKDAETAIRDETAATLKSLYPEATGGSLYEDTPVPGAIYWATFNLVSKQQGLALKKVIKRRKEGLPAELSFRRWDGSGSITVSPQRAATAPPRTPQTLAAVAGGIIRDETTAILQLLPRSIRSKPEESVPEPWNARLEDLAHKGPRSFREAAAVLADLRNALRDNTISPRGTVKVCAALREIAEDWPAAQWRNVILLQPGLSQDEWAALPPCERKRGEIRIRIGSGESESLETLHVVMHRPLPDDADIVQAQVTITRVTSTRLRAAVTLTCMLPAPEPKQKQDGPVIAVHTGWRALPDGAIRVAVITGATTPPPSGAGRVKDAASARRRLGTRRAGMRDEALGRPWAGDVPLTQESGIRDHGTWQEIVIPAQVRDTAGRSASLSGGRSIGMNNARKSIAAFLDRFPEMKEEVDPHGTLDRWRSPFRFRAALAVMTAHAPQAPETQELQEWSVKDTHLELWEKYAHQRHVLGWRKDMYRNIGAWLAGQASVIVTDSWPIILTRPGAEEEDTAQMEAARSNAVLAAPGELRASVKMAAGQRGAEYREAPAGLTRAHYRCGGELAKDERAKGVRVQCRACRKHVDQDLNAARAMAASAEATIRAEAEAASMADAAQ